jgi:hypothetical protein
MVRKSESHEMDELSLEASDLHPEEQSEPIISTDERMRIDVKPLEENA